MAYGKRRKNRNRKDGNKRPRRDEKESEDKFGQKREFIKTNESFEKYYKELIPENEFQDFLEALRRPLPLTFRITGTREEAAELRDLMKQHFFDKLKDIEVNGKKCPSPTPLPWYPNEFGWYYAAGRHEIRSVPVFSEFHSFLVQETELGNISRQEAVSMIPPMLLGVQSHHKVLDMCAAPGSKTAQLVEALHGNSNATPEGMIIANDIDTSRCYMLVHQTKRLQTPCFMVTNHNSGQYPNVYIQKENGAGSEILQFDRILCDVPCTGDGTLRKNPMIWRSWSPNSANSLHPLQCDILTRGLQMLKVGGRLVYSTCSFNPAENEAVLAKVLGANPDAYELIDVSKELSQLKREPGLHSWKVMDSERNFYTSYDQVPEALKEKIRPSLFPPSAEVAKSLHLERSIRIVPHSQDTGGFFVALIEKKKPVTAIDKKEENEQKEAQNDKEKEKEKEKDETQGDRKKRDKKRGKFSAKELKEDPFVFMDQETEDMKEMQSFYKFKNFEYDLLITRTDNESKKQIYLASRTIKRILTAPQNSNLRIINTGMRVFEKRNIKDKERIPCKFRIVQHGLRYMMPFLTAQVVEILESDFKQVLEGISVPFRCFSQFATDGFQKINDGCCTLVYKPVQHLKSEQRVSYIKTPVYLAGWKGKGAVQTLVAAKDRASLYVRLGYFELPESLKAEKNKEAKEEKKTEAASGFVDEENPIEKVPEGNEEGEDDDDEDEDGNEE